MENSSCNFITKDSNREGCKNAKICMGFFAFFVASRLISLVEIPHYLANKAQGIPDFAMP
jgi:hypothetical protein